MRPIRPTPARCGRRTSSGSRSAGGSIPTAGFRRYFESPSRPGEPITVDEYYGWLFDHSVPGLPGAAAREGFTPLQYMISHDNPLWVATADARRLGVATGDLVKVRTAIGYFVTRAWVTEGIRPGVLAMSHHLGRWRLEEELGGSRGASSLVTISREGAGRYRMRQVHGAAPFESADPDSSRIWWREVGVHQNATFPVQPDPVSGMHCWHQRVWLEKAGPDDRYGDIMVDTERAHEVYREWMERTRPAPGPDGLRRPLWFDRPLRPAPETYRIDEP